MASRHGLRAEGSNFFGPIGVEAVQEAQVRRLCGRAGAKGSFGDSLSYCALGSPVCVAQRGVITLSPAESLAGNRREGVVGGLNKDMGSLVLGPF